ncbi:MAG: hypothetical protein P8Y54_04090 [Xanthomonadales bacterium]|jgi:hypothetical protein
METQWIPGFAIALGLAVLFALLALLVRAARRGNRGAVLTGALFSMFAPDPELEKNIRLANEARQEQHEEDEDSADRDPENTGGRRPRT